MKDRRKSNWIQENWRSCAAFTYMIICLCDFTIFPTLSWLYAFITNTVMSPWSPLTLQGGAMLHLSFGAILATSSFGRSKEKVAAMTSTTPTAPTPTPE